MNKILKKGLLIVLVFLATLFVLRQFDWMQMLKVERATDKTEEKLGELIWDAIRHSEEEIHDPFVVSAVDSIVTKLCDANGIDRKAVKVHLLSKDEVNAFALPDGRIVIFSGLIGGVDTQEELGGVIGHELAHVRMNHVMKKLAREMGLAVLISMTTGDNGAGTIREAVRVLSSSAFDRKLEKEADIAAVDYLTEAEIDPEHLANFLYKISGGPLEDSRLISWISTHPMPRERAEYIIEYIGERDGTYESVLSEDTWSRLREALKE